MKTAGIICKHCGGSILLPKTEKYDPEDLKCVQCGKYMYTKSVVTQEKLPDRICKNTYCDNTTENGRSYCSTCYT